mmetsp:Transcript_60292/g.179117  ORF Transcript_60292/g.179117 Transcript_60292/m.179117 type:complete len:108 (-) Transcript_60292:289-612(-)
MLLPAVTRFSLAGAPARYAECSRAMGFAQPIDDDAAACAALTSGLDALCAALGVPTPAAHGIERGKWDALLDTMATQALGSGSPANNPIVPSHEQIVQLYREAYGAP